MGRGTRSKFMEIHSFSPLPIIDFEKMQFPQPPGKRRAAVRFAVTPPEPSAPEDDEQVPRGEGVEERRQPCQPEV